MESPQLTVIGGYAANNRLAARLFTEHFLIGPAVKKTECDVLSMTGFTRVRAPVPIGMHLLTLHHLNPENRIGELRSIYRRWVGGMDSEKPA